MQLSASCQLVPVFVNLITPDSCSWDSQKSWTIWFQDTALCLKSTFISALHFLSKVARKSVNHSSKYTWQLFLIQNIKEVVQFWGYSIIVVTLLFSASTLFPQIFILRICRLDLPKIYLLQQPGDFISNIEWRGLTRYEYIERLSHSKLNISSILVVLFSPQIEGNKLAEDGFGEYWAWE